MKITIQGQDYTAALDAVRPLTIERKINQPSICQLWLSLPANGSLAAPTRFQALAVTGDDGTPYFTGYIAVSPLPEYAGMGLEGPRYRTAIQAVSDEWLLDQMLMPPSAGVSNLTAGQVLALLIEESGSTSLSTAGLTLQTPVGSFVPDRGANWSKSAGQAASVARASYRALNGAVMLSSVQSTIHPLNETDGSLSLASLALTSSVKRELANDITVCGENEPAAYVTEYFLGDGVTAEFYLSEDPYFPPTSQSTIVRELFNAPQINPALWCARGDNYFGLGSNGLTIDGGNGNDGQTTLAWLNPIEMGGTLLLELVGVTLSPGSTGILGGFFNGSQTMSGCTAGIQATAQAGTGNVTLQPIVMGAAAGTTFAVNSANQYTLRLRIRCPESYRVGAMYYSCGDSGLIGEGGAWVAAPGNLHMEVQEFVNGVGATPVTIYEGAIANLPAPCNLIPVSSINLIGAIRAINLTNLGSGWVVSTPPSGGAYTRRIGTTAEAAECYVERTGKLVFYTGSTPAMGEVVVVQLPHHRPRRGPRCEHRQPAGARAGRIAVGGRVDRLSDRPAGAQFHGLPQCRTGDSQAAASVSALWSGTYKGNAPALRATCGRAMRCSSMRLPPISMRRSWCARSRSPTVRARPTLWNTRLPLPTTGPMTWPSKPAPRCRRMRGFRPRRISPCFPI